MSQPLRLFLALDISAEAKAALAATQMQLSEADPLTRVRWVRPEGTHLTLYFFGNVAPDNFEAIQTDCRAAVAAAPPVGFSLRLAELGTFPSLRQPRVLWVGVQGDLSALRATQQIVANALNVRGHRPVDHAFNPHITLGRLREDASPTDRSAAGAALQTMSPQILAALAAVPPFTIACATLYRSRLQPGGSVYEPVAQYGFGNADFR